MKWKEFLVIVISIQYATKKKYFFPSRLDINKLYIILLKEKLLL